MYRLHIQAENPIRFKSMAGVICYLRHHCPLWYELEEWVDDGWEIIVRRDESRLRIAFINDPGESDRT